MEKEKEEELFDDSKEKKELKKEEKGKSTFNRIMNVILWIVLFIWMGICLVDFFKTRAEAEPIFCIKKETVKYDDGEVDSCLGLGYKIYHYKRTSFNGIEYGPFWSKDRSAEKSEK